MTQTTKPTTQPRLTLERTFDATPDRLWEYWVDPTKYARWLSPQKADLVIHEFDARVGGKVRFDMPLDNGQVNKEEGVFHVLDRPRRLVSGSADKSFLIDVTFTPMDGGKRTRLDVVITGVPPEWHDAARQGWGVGFGKLDRLLSGAGTSAAEGAEAGTSRTQGRTRDETEPLGPGDGFRLVRTLAAPPEKVWAMWTTKAGLDKWWRLAAKDMGFDFRVAALDVRVGGKYDIVMSNQEHGELHNHGEYLEVVPDRRLVQRWDFDIFLAPGETSYPIAVRVELEPIPAAAGGGTRMTFTQDPMASPGHSEGSRQGVRANFAKLEAALAS